MRIDKSPDIQAGCSSSQCLRFEMDEYSINDYVDFDSLLKVLGDACAIIVDDRELVGTQTAVKDPSGCGDGGRKHNLRHMHRRYLKMRRVAPKYILIFDLRPETDPNGPYPQLDDWKGERGEVQFYSYKRHDTQFSGLLQEPVSLLSIGPKFQIRKSPASYLGLWIDLSGEVHKQDQGHIQRLLSRLIKFFLVCSFIGSKFFYNTHCSSGSFLTSWDIMAKKINYIEGLILSTIDYDVEISNGDIKRVILQNGLLPKSLNAKFEAVEIAEHGLIASSFINRESLPIIEITATSAQ